IVPDAQGCCVVTIGHQTYILEVPRETILDESLAAALCLFADGAQDLSPETSLQGMLKQPFFSPGIIRHSLHDIELREMDRRIENEVSYLLRVFGRPRRALTVEHRIVPIDRARRPAAGFLEHLAARPELWHSRTAAHVRPARLLAEVPEETL